MADSSKPSTSNTNPDQKKRWQAKKNLFEKAMKGQWKEVLDIYGEYPWIHDAKITRSGATALHIAVSDGKEDIVEELIKIIITKSGRSKVKDVLSVADELGNTPLHTAATLGKEKMCRCIAGVDKSLIGIRNKDSETPFFTAALHGHKHAFLCLHELCEHGNGYEYSRRNDGETILHCAISGDYFDLAFQIIHLYENLVNSVNEVGLSPLHLLAAKPTAFRSGSHLGRCNALIYHCIFVDELEKTKSNNQSSPPKPDGEKPFYPPNYETCHHLITLLWKAIIVVTKTATRGTGGNEGKPDPPDAENPESNQRNIKLQGHQLFPPNYSSWFEFVKLVSKAMLVVLGLGSNNIRKLREKKQKHTWSVQVMNKLLERASMYEYENDGTKPQPPPSGQEEDSQETKPYDFDAGGDTIFAFGEDPLDKIGKPVPTNDIASRSNQNEKMDAKNAEDRKNPVDMKDEILEMNKKESPILIAAKNGITDIVEKIREMFPVAIHDMNYPNKNVVLLAVENRQPHVYQKESPILIAAKNGITEIVEKVLEMFPVAIHDMNYQKKNVALLAVENRQPHVYQLLLKIITNMKESVFRKVDYEGNSALHLAARLGEHKPWLIPGAALQMQWEIKWYEFVKESMPFHFFVRYNKQNKSPKEVFTESHKELVKAGGEWLTNTSESCSVVAALIATVAFATSTAVPGGVKEESGTPTLENQPAFNVFAISSLVALCFSVTAVVLFLAILTSRYQERDFGKDLPRKLLLGLTSLFVSIGSMLISFCAGHFFVLKDKLKYAAWPVYAVTCLPITFFAIAQFPLYFDLIWTTFKKVPQRSYKSIPK